MSLISTACSKEAKPSHRFLLALSLAAWLFGFASHLSAKPNVIVIFTDDQGYADLSAQGQLDDIKTPHIDALAGSGVRCTAGYVTSPQCSPSRAGLLTGRYQQRFGFDENPDCPLPLEELTIAERLNQVGYICGMVGKWHLEPNFLSQKWLAVHYPDQVGKPRSEVRIPIEEIHRYSPHAQGFQEFFLGSQQQIWANFDLDGNSLTASGQSLNFEDRYRIDLKTDAALSFLQRNQDKNFFLYLSYMAPHTPLEATERYLKRFPGEMPTRRRYALAMQSAIDDGVGRVMEFLKQNDLEENTLVFYLSDNGAPIHNRRDSPIHTDMGGWDGSLNDPWRGEKGRLSEGGIRVPFIASWKGRIPSGQVYDHPVSSLDIAATVVAAADFAPIEALDGVDLVPYFSKQRSGAPHDALFWRFRKQFAIRLGKWKYIQDRNAGHGLFDLSSENHEGENLINDLPEIASRLRERLYAWSLEIEPPSLPENPPQQSEPNWLKKYFKEN